MLIDNFFIMDFNPLTGVTLEHINIVFQTRQMQSVERGLILQSTMSLK